MTYRTKTYIAADWTGDKDAVDQLYKWNNSEKWSLSFTDAHELTQARDESLSCTIKSSLSARLDASKTFVLIVGSKTKALTNGGCQHCTSYNSHTFSCARGYNIDYRSYINFECAKAIRDQLKIVVLHNSASVDRSKCPDLIKYEGSHTPMWYFKDGEYYWNYTAVKNAIEG